MLAGLIYLSFSEPALEFYDRGGIIALCMRNLWEGTKMRQVNIVKKILIVLSVSCLVLTAEAKAQVSPVTHYFPGTTRIDYVEFFEEGQVTPISTKVYKYTGSGDQQPYQIIEYKGSKGVLEAPYLDPYHSGNGFFDPYLNFRPGFPFSPAFPRTTQKNIKSLTIYSYSGGQSTVRFNNDLVDREYVRFFDQDANGSYETSDFSTYYFAGTKQKRAEEARQFHWSQNNTQLVSYEYTVTEWNRSGQRVGPIQKDIFYFRQDNPSLWDRIEAYEDGKLVTKEVYVNGVFDRIEHYDPQGRIDYIEHFENNSTTPVRTEVYNYFPDPSRYKGADYQIYELTGAKGNWAPSQPLPPNIKSVTTHYPNEKYEGVAVSRLATSDLTNGEHMTHSVYCYKGTNQKKAEAVVDLESGNLGLPRVKQTVTTNWDENGLQTSVRKTVPVYTSETRFDAWARIETYLNGKIENIEYFETITTTSPNGGYSSNNPATKIEHFNEQGRIVATDYLVDDIDKNGKKDDNDILLFHEWATGARKHLDVLFGDVNDDGRVTISDVSFIRQDLLRIKTLEREGDKYLADVDQDGDVDSFDLSLMQRYIHGVAAVWPPFKDPSLPLSASGVINEIQNRRAVLSNRASLPNGITGSSELAGYNNLNKNK